MLGKYIFPKVLESINSDISNTVEVKDFTYAWTNPDSFRIVPDAKVKMKLVAIPFSIGQVSSGCGKWQRSILE